MGQFHASQFYIPQLGEYLIVADLCSVEKKTYPHKNNFLFLSVNKGNNGYMFYCFSVLFFFLMLLQQVCCNMWSVAVEIQCSCIREILTDFLSWIKDFIQSLKVQCRVLFVQYLKISQNLRNSEGERCHQYSRLKHFVNGQGLFWLHIERQQIVIVQLLFKITGCFQ